RHLVRSHHRRKRHVFRRRLRIEPLDHLRERYPLPRDDHRPGFDAAKTVSAINDFMRLDQILEVVVARPPAESLDAHAPRLWMKARRVVLRVLFVRSELVEVVVRRDLLVRVELVLWLLRETAVNLR